MAIGQGIITSMYGGGAVIGLSVGGVIIQHYSWHATFFSLIPISILLLVINWRFIHVDNKEGLELTGKEKEKEQQWMRKRQQLQERRGGAEPKEEENNPESLRKKTTITNGGKSTTSTTSKPTVEVKGAIRQIKK